MAARGERRQLTQGGACLTAGNTGAGGRACGDSGAQGYAALPNWLYGGGQRSVPKSYRDGTHRSVAPEATLARVLPHAAAMGITRLANVTGLDRIGIPVVMACRPNSRSLAVAQGKGIDLDAAKASALMETIEAYHAEQIDLPLRLGTYADLCARLRLADIGRLPRRVSVGAPQYLPVLWVEGFDLLQDVPTWVPFEMVSVDYTRPSPIPVPCFSTSSNGLASGNNLLEAISHAICEAVERDATRLWELQSRSEGENARLDLDSVSDPRCQRVLEMFAQAGVSVAVWDVTSDVGIACFTCVIADQDADPMHPMYGAAGAGCHPDRGIALLRALTEAAQSRLTAISGARDDIDRTHYERSLSPEVLDHYRAVLTTPGAGRPFAAVPHQEADTFDADVAWELDRLRAVGIEQVVVVDLTRSEFGIPVARVVIPGLEARQVGSAYAAGERVKRLQVTTE